MITKQAEEVALWDDSYNDEAILYNDALICLHEAEILSGSDDESDISEAAYLVEVAFDLMDNIYALDTEALRLRARTLEEKLDIN